MFSLPAYSSKWIAEPVSRTLADAYRYRIKNKTAGFSLVELLIVIVIVGVLASLAIPSYQHYMTVQRRADAHHLLLFNNSQLAKCFTLAGSYENDCNLLTTSKDGYYELSTNLTATTWSITATPVSTEAQSKDDECKSIVLNHIGIKSATGTNSGNCW